MTFLPPSESASARKLMVESQLRPQGVSDPLVLAAMGSVPREDHVPESARAIAYGDRSIPLGDGRALMAPAALGQLLQAMAPVPGERGLVIAPAGDYTATLLAAMGVNVDTAQSKQGGYDLVIIDGAVEAIPDDVIALLADGGRLGAAIVDRGVTRLVIGRKTGTAFGTRSLADAAVPIVPGSQRPAAFAF